MAAWHLLRRWGWLLLAGVVAAVAWMLFRNARQRRRLVAPVLEQAHEADVAAKRTRWRLGEHERAEIAAARQRAKERLDAVDRESFAAGEGLRATNPSALLAYYREVDRQARARPSP